MEKLRVKNGNRYSCVNDLHLRLLRNCAFTPCFERKITIPGHFLLPSKTSRFTPGVSWGFLGKYYGARVSLLLDTRNFRKLDQIFPSFTRDINREAISVILLVLTPFSGLFAVREMTYTGESSVFCNR